jgi:hypothetical protein
MKLRRIIAGAMMLLASCPALLLSQDLKAQAQKEFENQRYGKAIQLLKQAVKENPKNGELYYYLGYYTHYLCYDSMPLSGYNSSMSTTIISYLKKALELDPTLRDAYSFLGAEYGARALLALQGGDWKGFVENLKFGRGSGGYPDWMVECARNVLKSCGKDAILFCGGDAETFPIWYCQFVEKFRTDVSAVPVALMPRPWFALVLESGLGEYMRPLPISWSKEQIMAMQPYKWKEQAIGIPIPAAARAAFAVKDTTFKWNLRPDLSLGESGSGLLGAGRALIADIVRTNAWKRPIHFSLGCQPDMFAGLEDNFQLTGLSLQLVPFNASEAGRKINVEASLPILSDPANFRSVPTLKTSNIPRNSGLLQNYRVASLQACMALVQAKDLKRARALFSNMEASVPEKLLPVPEEFKPMIEMMRGMLQSGK